MAVRTFEQWIDWVFNHPVTEPAWYWNVDADTDADPDDEVNVAYITRLFTECDRLLARFDNAQVNQGLKMVYYVAFGQVFSVTDGNAPWPARQAAIRAIFDLNEKLFARRCQEGLSHLKVEEVTNPLNYACFIWWDEFPCMSERSKEPSRASEVDEYFAVLQRCLAIPHQACIEGALHGLGHWHLYFPERVEQVIDRFLHTHADLRPELLAYAGRAREGLIQ